MGIRFRCHNCDHQLHVKDFQGGKRGRCPECKGAFRIPRQDAPTSEPVLEGGTTAPQANSTASKLPANAPASGDETADSPGAESLELVEQPTLSQTEAAPANTELAPTPQDTAGRAEPLSTATMQEASAPANPEAAGPELPVPTPATALAQNPAELGGEEISWYVRPASGGQFGPANGPTFSQWLSEGRVSGDSHIWRDGWPDWQIAQLALPAYFASPIAMQPAAASPAPPALGQPATNAAAPELAGQASPVEGQSPLPANASASQPSPGGVGNISPAEMTRMARRNKKRKQYRILLAVLFVMAVVLVVALILVLISQSGS